MDVPENISVDELKKEYLMKLNKTDQRIRMFAMGKELLGNKPLYFYKLDSDFIIQIQLGIERGP